MNDGSSLRWTSDSCADALTPKRQLQCLLHSLLHEHKNSSGNKLPYLSPLTLPSPPLFPLRGAVEREAEPVTYFRTSPNFARFVTHSAWVRILVQDGVRSNRQLAIAGGDVPALDNLFITHDIGLFL